MKLMQVQLKRLQCGATAAFMLMLVPCRISKAADADTTPPETAYNAAVADLLNLQKKVKSARELWNQQTLEPKKIAAKDALERARAYYENSEYLSSIREINAFQDFSQSHETRSFLDAMFYLGNSYDALGFESQALKAYLRYIAAFTANPQPDYPEFCDIMSNLMALASRQSLSSKAETARIISAVTTLDLPEDLKPQVLFAASRTARDSGRPDLARSWLEQTPLEKLKGETGAKLAYFRGVLLLAQGDDNEAETSLLAARDMTDVKDNSVHDLAVLALARIETKRHNFTKALRYYQGISPEANGYRSALYETVFLSLRIHQEKVAEESARNFLKRYTDGADTLQIKTTLAYILLRAGRKDEASNNLADSDTSLNTLIGKIRVAMRGKLRVSHGELLNLFESAEMILRQSPVAEEGLRLFAKLAELRRRVADNEGDLRSLIFTMGRMEFSQLLPRYTMRSNQLQTLTEELLTIGHKLIATERQTNAVSLTPAQLARLDASERRRTKLLEQAAKASRGSVEWAAFSDSMSLQSKLIKEYESLGRVSAQLAAARFLSERKLKQAPASEKSNEKPTADFAAEEARIREMLLQTVQQLRSLAVKSLTDSGPHVALKKLLTQYGSALYQEDAILSQIRDKKDYGYQLLDAQDATHAWALWRVAAKEIYSSTTVLGDMITADIKRTLADHEKIFEKSASTKSLIDNTTRRLELAMGQSISTLLEHYESEYMTRASQNQKLRADLEWSRFEDAAKESDEHNRKFEKEQQEYRDSIQDLREGVTSP